MTGGELQTELETCKAIYLAGMEVPEQVLRQGLDSGNRLVKGAAAELSGLTKFNEAGPLLVRLAQDRAWKFPRPRAAPLRVLGNRDIIPLLISDFNERNDEKAAAVEWSLLRLGGKDIASSSSCASRRRPGQRALPHLLPAIPPARLRGKRLLIDVMRQMPTL